MEPRTHRRVLLDTTPRRLGRWLALSVALHVPLTPVAALLGLLSLLRPTDDIPTLPPVTEIPLDIIEDEEGPGAAKTPEPEVKAPEPVAVQPDLPKDPEPAAEKPKPKPKASAEPKDAGPPEDAGKPEDAGTPRKPGEGIGSPVAGIGDKKVVDPNANVQVLVHNDRVRQHPLGGRVGPLLRRVYQWRDFFGPTAIDPVRDIDRMLVVGPQLRDSRAVVAILQFNVPADRVKGAVDALVSHDPQGEWMDAGVPVAKAHADRGERFFVMPSPQVLVVTPESARAAAERLPRKFRLPGPKGDEIALAKLATPWRAFLGMPVVIPKSITSAEIRLSPMPDGGVMIDILAHDETEPLAKSDAEQLTQTLQTATTLDLLFTRKKLIQKGSFEPDGTDIRGEIVLTRLQVEEILDFAGMFLAGQQPRPKAASPPPTPSSPIPAPSSQ